MGPTIVYPRVKNKVLKEGLNRTWVESKVENNKKLSNIRTPSPKATE